MRPRAGASRRPAGTRRSEHSRVRDRQRGAISECDFARLIERLGPFEKHPVIAVAVSGGADSLALTLLLDRWARRRGGKAIGLTVEHGLRAGSAEEARQVGIWLGERGIAHAILPWRGRKPCHGLQARAREARYRLLARHCRANAILHLALAHHRDDQSETFLLRLGRQSGLDGLAAMPAVREQDGLRWLRPLLALPKARLVATLRSLGQPWIEDPSNENPRFERVRLRQSLPQLEIDPMKLAATAFALGRARAAGADAVAGLLVEIELHPGGIAILPGGWLALAPRAQGLRALARLIQSVGGGAYAPRRERLERGYEWLTGGKGRGMTLGHCRFLRHRGRCFVLTEEAPAPIGAGKGRVWRPLGAAGWRRFRDRHPAPDGFPALCGARLPALWRGPRLEAVPALGYRRKGLRAALPAGLTQARHPLISARFAVA